MALISRGLLTGALRGADTALGRRADRREAERLAEEEARARAEAQKSDLMLKLQLALAQEGVNFGPGNDTPQNLMGLMSSAARARAQDAEMQASAAAQRDDLKAKIDFIVKNPEIAALMERENISPSDALNQPELLLPIVAGVQSEVSKAKKAEADLDARATEALIASRERSNRPKPVDPLLTERRQKLEAETDAATALAESRRREDAPQAPKPVKRSARVEQEILQGGDDARAAEFAAILEENRSDPKFFGLAGDKLPRVVGTKQAEREGSFMAGQEAAQVLEWKKRLDSAELKGQEAAKRRMDTLFGSGADSAPGDSEFSEGVTEPIPPELQPWIDKAQDQDAAVDWIRRQLDAGNTPQEILAAIKGE